MSTDIKWFVTSERIELSDGSEIVLHRGRGTEWATWIMWDETGSSVVKRDEIRGDLPVRGLPVRGLREKCENMACDYEAVLKIKRFLDETPPELDEAARLVNMVA